MSESVTTKKKVVSNGAATSSGGNNRSHALPAQIDFVEYDLDNGMHVILAESHHVPLVSVNLWYHIGSKEEDTNRTGFAHLFEHMMFQGSANVRKAEHFKYIQNVGGTLNASTSQDRTNYYQTVPSSELELAFWLESDRMLSLAVTHDNFENQRAVVKEERRQRYESRPYGLVYEHLLERVFPTSGYHWPTIGSMKHLDDASLQDVIDFHQKYYKTNNASLTVIGDFDPVNVRELIDRYFGSIPAGDPIVRKVQEITPITQQIRHTMEDTVKLPAIYLGWQGTTAFSEDEAALDLLTNILSNGRSSRLYRSLVYEQKLAKEVSVASYANEAAGLLLVDAIAQVGVDVKAVETAIWSELDRIARDGVTEKEVTKSKNKLEAGFVRGLTGLASRADHLQRAYTYTRDTENANRELGHIRSVTAEDIQRVARKYFRPESCVALEVQPKAG